MRLVGGIGNSLQAIRDKPVQALKALKALRVTVKKRGFKKNSHGIVPQYAGGNLPPLSIQHGIRNGSMVMSQMNDVYPNT